MATHGPDASREHVPDVVAPPPHHPRFPLSDGARGFAAMAILVGHAWLFTGMFGDSPEAFPNRLMMRMDGLIAVFFGLSAFLLYRPMIAHRARGPASPRVSDYYLRRVLRLYPAYWVALTALAIVPGLFGVFSDKWWTFYTLTDYLEIGDAHSVCPRVVSGGIDQFVRCGLPQSWSLGVEMTFYLVLPLYAGVTALIARGREVRSWMRIELVLLALLAALSVILAEAPFSLREEPWYRFSFLGHFYWIALGLTLAVLSVVYRHSEPPGVLRLAASRPGACWAGAFAVYLFTVFAFYPAPFSVSPFTGFEYVSLNLLQGVAAVLLLLPVVFGNPNRGVPSRVFGHPVLMSLGVISYGVVLWHMVIALNLGYLGADESFVPVLIGTILLTIPLAALSYYLIERPLMKFKYRSPREVFSEWRRDRRGRRAVPTAGESST